MPGGGLTSGLYRRTVSKHAAGRVGQKPKPRKNRRKR